MDGLVQKIGIALGISSLFTDIIPALHAQYDLRRRGVRLYIALQSGEEELTFANKLKGIVEDLTGETWNWWPFRPRFLPLSSTKRRIEWSCVSP